MKRIVLLFSALMILAGCQAPTAGYGSLEGVVYPKDNQDKTLSMVAVIYGDSATYTNIDGFFRYDTIPEGLQGLTFKKDGYFDVVKQLNISRDIVNTTTVEMELARCGWAVGNLDSYFGTILRTTNGGDNWVRQGAPSIIPEVNLIDVCTINDNECFIVGEPDTVHRKSTILYTNNGGNEWKNLAPQSIPLVSYGSIISKDGKKIWCASNDSSVIILSSDAGKSWKLSINSENMKYYSAITTYDGTNIWACGMAREGGAAIEYSADGGTSWEFIPVGASTGIQAATDIYADIYGTIFLTGDTGMGLMVSEDMGHTWESVESMGTGNSLFTLSVVEGSKIWTASEAGTLFYYADTGKFFNSFPQDAQPTDYVKDISFLRDGLCGSAIITQADNLGSSIYYTTDGGLNWSKSTIPYNFILKNIDFVGGNN